MNIFDITNWVTQIFTISQILLTVFCNIFQLLTDTIKQSKQEAKRDAASKGKGGKKKSTVLKKSNKQDIVSFTMYFLRDCFVLNTSRCESFKVILWICLSLLYHYLVSKYGKAWFRQKHDAWSWLGNDFT